MKTTQYVAVVMDGVIHVHGPFNEQEKAQSWADANLCGEYWVQEINPIFTEEK